jgi:hypothetical protein
VALASELSKSPVMPFGYLAPSGGNRLNRQRFVRAAMVCQLLLFQPKSVQLGAILKIGPLALLLKIVLQLPPLLLKFVSQPYLRQRLSSDRG